MEELKPCPFCGSTELQRRGNNDAEYMNSYIECMKCHAYGPSANSSALGTAKTSEEVWNARAERADTMPLPLDADGVPIEVGDVVYCDGGDEAMTASFFRVDNAGQTQTTVKDSGGAYYTLSPSRLSHTRPDSWERLEKDATENPEAYCRANGCELPPNPGRADYADAFASDLVRRAKALAKAGE